METRKYRQLKNYKFLIDENMTNYLDVNEMKIEIIKLISNYEVKNDNDLLNMCSECYSIIYDKINKENEIKTKEENEWKKNYNGWGFNDSS